MSIQIKKIRRCLVIFIIVLPCLEFVSAQGFNSWQDGNPLFAQPYPVATNLLVDSTVQLVPAWGESQENESFLFILSGLDWRWPIAELGLPAAEDIDFYSFGGKLYYLVTDGTGRRIFAINVATNENVWEFKSDPTETSPKFLRQPTDAFYFIENSAEKVLLTDRGRNRVIKIDKYSKDIEWAYSDTDAGLLSSPADAIKVPDTTQVMICDKGNNRILVVNEEDSTIAWEWGPGTLNQPVDIEYLAATSQILVTDQQNHRVILVGYPDSNIDFQFGLGYADSTENTLNTPTDADALPNGNFLICDAGNKRLIEVNPLGTIVWAFHRRLEELKDADRLEDGRTLAIFHDSLYKKILPTRLAYISGSDSSNKRDLGRKVIFDSLYWDAQTSTDTTSIRLQLRTARSYADLESAAWMGPAGSGSYYEIQPALINPVHNGDRWCQFKAFLETNDPLFTPVLRNVRLGYHYFNTDCTGTIISEAITDEPDVIITNWDSLFYRTKLPSENREALQINLYILDAQTDAALFVSEGNQYVERDTLILSEIPKLTGVQAIKLKATLNTLNSSITPCLQDWRITWSNTISTTAELQFVNENKEQVTHYRATTRYEPGQEYVDWVKLSLFDGNIIPIHSQIELKIHAKLSRDSVGVKLKQSAGLFVDEPGKPAIVTNFVDFENSIIEIFDRDTLTAIYTDPTDPGDSDTARVVMVLNTDAQIQFENRYHTKIDSANLNDTVYVRISGEFDRNLSAGQDTIYITVVDNQNGENESFAAVEQPDTSGQYSTGEFLTEVGIPLVSEVNGIQRDSLVQTNAGRQIIAKYEDNGMVSATLRIPASGNLPPVVVVSLDKPYDFIIAPNPFYADRHSYLRLRAASTIGDMRLTSIEIFNLAGEKIRELNGEIFSSGAFIPRDQYAEADNWWNLTTDSGHQISSGTYWIKFNANLLSSQNGGEQSVNVIKKVLILR